MSILEGIAMFCAGVALGLLFFGGLNWTIHRLPHTRHPMALALGSLLVRTALLVGAILWVGQAIWQRYVVILAGILVARVAAVRVWGMPRTSTAKPPETEGE